MAGLEDTIRKLSVGEDNIIATISKASAADAGKNGRCENTPRDKQPTVSGAKKRGTSHLIAHKERVGLVRSARK